MDGEAVRLRPHCSGRTWRGMRCRICVCITMYEYNAPRIVRALLSMSSTTHCGRTHLVVPTCRPLPPSRPRSWSARRPWLRLTVVLVLQAGQLRCLRGQRVVSSLISQQRTSPPVPGTLTEGAASLPKRRGRHRRLRLRVAGPPAVPPVQSDYPPSPDGFPERSKGSALTGPILQEDYGLTEYRL